MMNILDGKKIISTTVYDCTLIELPKVHNRAGSITIAENMTAIPFEVQRVYYLYDIPNGSTRGGHAHIDLFQLIVAASGSFEVVLDDGKLKRTFFLNRPDYGLLVPPGLWRELVNFSSGSILMVLASLKYDEKDYIRLYDDFLEFKQS